MDLLTTSLIACRDCDLLQRKIELPPGGVAVCRCCGASLYRHTPDSIHRTLALSLAAALLFIIANVYPVLEIELQGERSATNLLGAVLSLWTQDMHIIAILVLGTVFLIPLFELSTLLYLLLPLTAGGVPPAAPLIMGLLRSLKPWEMVEVLMLGILVSLIKLKDTSIIIPGIALWSFGALTLLTATIKATFNPMDIWERIYKESGIEKTG